MVVDFLVVDIQSRNRIETDGLVANLLVMDVLIADRFVPDRFKPDLETAGLVRSIGMRVHGRAG